MRIGPLSGNGSSVVVTIAALTAAVFAADSLLPSGYAVWLFYAVPLLLSIRLPRTGISYAISAILTALIAGGIFIGPSTPAADITMVVAFNRTAGIISFWIIAYLSERYRYTGELKRLNRDLGDANTRLHREMDRRKLLADRLETREHEFRTLVESSPDPIVRFDAGMRYLYVNPAYERVTGATQAGLAGKPFDATETPELSNHWTSTFRDVFATGNPGSIEFSLAGREGRRLFWGLVIPQRDDRGQIRSVMMISRDITERARTEERIRYISFHDTVTGLFNRAYFEEEVKRLDTERALPVSVIMGDVNNLKLTNDVFGHAEGDTLLRTVAQSLRDACRDEDVVARWGGDEFAVILPRTGRADAGEVCERIRHALREARGTVVPASIALGTAAKSETAQKIYRVIRDAEKDMYDTKLAESAGVRDSVIRALLADVTEKYPATPGHVARLETLAETFAETGRLTEAQREDLLLLIRLHPLGKAVVPAGLPARTEPLTPGERETLQRSVEAGFRVTRTFAETARISDGMLTLCERWDGGGYPRGLKGKDIPFPARVLSILDTWDILTHDRRRGRRLSPREADEALRRDAGRRFDPGLTRLFLERVRVRERVRT